MTEELFLKKVLGFSDEEYKDAVRRRKEKDQCLNKEAFHKAANVLASTGKKIFSEDGKKFIPKRISLKAFDEVKFSILNRNCSFVADLPSNTDDTGVFYDSKYSVMHAEELFAAFSLRAIPSTYLSGKVDAYDAKEESSHYIPDSSEQNEISDKLQSAFLKAYDILKNAKHPSIVSGFRLFNPELLSLEAICAMKYRAYRDARDALLKDENNNPMIAEEFLASIVIRDLPCDVIQGKGRVFSPIRRVSYVEQYFHLLDLEERTTDKKIAKLVLDNAKRKIFVGGEEFFHSFIEEFDKILNHTEEYFGYKINHISSGRMTYDVNSYIYDDKGNCSIVPAGSYSSEEEAKLNATGESDIVEEGYDPNDWWAIIGPDGENTTNSLYCCRAVAIAHLINLLSEKLRYWSRWSELMDDKERLLSWF